MENTSWLEWFAIQVLKCGPIPKHVALIMDGNRRFAKKQQKETFFGHKSGFETLKNTLRVCMNLGMTEVSVYAFSIENFKRTKTEVEGLMTLAHEKLKELIESGFLQQHGVCVKIYGEISLLPNYLQDTIARITEVSKDFTKARLNVYMSYTARHELMRCMNLLANSVINQELSSKDITEEVFEKHLFTGSIPDILIRTSGETRLSDFLLWQASFSSIHFYEVLWPEFSSWHVFLSVLNYQLHHSEIQNNRKMYFKHLEDYQKSNKLV